MALLRGILHYMIIKTAHKSLHCLLKLPMISVLKVIKNIRHMSKTIWVIILIIVVVLLWYLFKGDSADDAADTTTEDGTEQVDENAAAAVGGTVDVSVDTGDIMDEESQ
jgi:hypothetical protein